MSDVSIKYLQIQSHKCTPLGRAFFNTSETCYYRRRGLCNRVVPKHYERLCGDICDRELRTELGEFCGQFVHPLVVLCAHGGLCVLARLERITQLFAIADDLRNPRQIQKQSGDMPVNVLANILHAHDRLSKESL